MSDFQWEHLSNQAIAGASNHSSARRKRSHSAPSRRSSPEGSRDGPLLPIVAEAIMAAFPTPITVPISVGATRSTWGVPG